MNDFPDLWDEPVAQIEAERRSADRHLAHAAVEPLWGFLSDAGTSEEFRQRLALSDDSIKRMLGEVGLGEEWSAPIGQAFSQRHTAVLAQRQQQAEEDQVAQRLAAKVGSLPEGVSVGDTVTVTYTNRNMLSGESTGTKTYTGEVVGEDSFNKALRLRQYGEGRRSDSNSVVRNIPLADITDIKKSGARKTAAKWIDLARKVVDTKGYVNVDVMTGKEVGENDGVLLDMTTANMLVQIYDALSPENRAKFDAMPLDKATIVGWKLIERQRTGAAKTADQAWKYDRWQQGGEGSSWKCERDGHMNLGGDQCLVCGTPVSEQQKTSAKTAGKYYIKWKVENHFLVDYLKGKAPNGDNYSIYDNPNDKPLPVHWVNYGKEYDDDTAPLGYAKARSGQFATFAEALADAEAYAKREDGVTASKTALDDDWIEPGAFLPARSEGVATPIIDNGLGSANECRNCGMPIVMSEGQWHHMDPTNGEVGTMSCSGKGASRRTAVTSTMYRGERIAVRKGAPFAGYEDFEACVRANSDKDDPEAYCGKIKHQVEDSKTSALDEAFAKIAVSEEEIRAAVEAAAAEGFGGWAQVNAATRALGLTNVMQDPDTFNAVAEMCGFGPNAFGAKFASLRGPARTADRTGPTIDSAEGYEYTPAPEWVAKACRKRFEGGGATAVDPKNAGQYLHGVGNFWDGPSVVTDNGDGSLSYRNPYTGDTDRFNDKGYWSSADGQFKPWGSAYASLRGPALTALLGKRTAAGARQKVYDAGTDAQGDFEGPSVQDLEPLIDKYVEIVFYNEHGVAADHEIGRIREVRRARSGIAEIEWEGEGSGRTYPIEADNIGRITRLEEPVEVGQPRLFEMASRKTAARFSMEGVHFRLDNGSMIGWMSDWGVIHDPVHNWLGRGLVESVPHNSGGLGGASYRLTARGHQLAEQINDDAPAPGSGAWERMMSASKTALYERTGQTYTDACDTCGRDVVFEWYEIPGVGFRTSYPVEDGAGSDHLGTWCPEHEPLRYRRKRMEAKHAAAHECEHAGDHHSGDVTAIYHGRSEPTYLCGYHASQVDDLSDFPRKTAFAAPMVQVECRKCWNREYSTNPGRPCSNCGASSENLQIVGSKQAASYDSGMPEGFVPVRWYVYKVALNGTGYQVDGTGEMLSREQGQVAIMGLRERDRIRNGKPEQYYLVAEDAKGFRVPDFGDQWQAPHMSALEILRTADLSDEEALGTEAAYFNTQVRPTTPPPPSHSEQTPTSPGNELVRVRNRQVDPPEVVDAHEQQVEMQRRTQPQQGVSVSTGGRRQAGVPDSAKGPNEITCDACDGGGVAWDMTCQKCGGWGVIDRSERSKTMPRQAVNEDAYGADRYQQTPSPATPDWIHDAWGQRQEPIPHLDPARDNPFSKETLERVERQNAEVREAARLARHHTAVDLEGFEQGSDFDPESAGSLPRTTRPRVMPNEHRPPQELVRPEILDDSAFPDADISGFASPTTAQRTQARIATLTRRVLADNPTMSRQQARAIAAKTVEKFPEMVKG